MPTNYSARKWENQVDSVNPLSHQIVDVDCVYEDGKFVIKSLTSNVPGLFTVRFTAPADYIAGNTIVVKGTELPLRTPGMTAATSDMFKAGAVLHCDIDMDRELAFICSQANQHECGCRHQTGNLSFYIDPNGDDSLNNPGTQNSPFRTMAGARNAVSQRYIFTSMGSLTYNINPGTYELDADNRNAVGEATHPVEIIFQASDPNNKPLMTTDYFISGRGHRTYANLRLAGNNSHVLCAHRNAGIIVRSCEVIAQASNISLVYVHSNGVIYLQESLTLDGGGYAQDIALGCHQAQILIHSGATVPVKVQNVPSVGRFAHCDGGNLFVPNMIFSGSTTGSRYIVTRGGSIETGGKGGNYFPGSSAGTIGSYSFYN